MASKNRLPSNVELLVSQTDEIVKRWTMEESKAYLNSKVKKETKQETEDSLRRQFVPRALYDDSLYLTTTLLVGPQGMAKTTLARYIASALKDDWLNGSVFRYEPLICFTNSLRMGIKYVDENYDGHDYILLFIDDAIRHASSKKIFSATGLELVNDIAEIRHILADQCGVEPPCYLHIIWATQRFKELSTFARSCDRAIYKGLATLGTDKDAVYREVGVEAYTWLLQINRMVKSYQEFDYLNHFVLISDPEEDPEYCVAEFDRDALHSFPLIRDDLSENSVPTIANFVLKHFESDEVFPKLIGRQLGTSLVKATVRKYFPDTTANMTEVIDTIRLRLYNAGKLDYSKNKPISQRWAKEWKFRVWKAAYNIEHLLKEDPETWWPAMMALGYGDQDTLRKAIAKCMEEYKPIPTITLPPKVAVKKMGWQTAAKEAHKDYTETLRKAGVKYDGTIAE